MTRLFLRRPDGVARFVHEEVAYPAAYWRSGDSIVLGFLNSFTVPLPQDLAPDTYEVILRLVSIVDWRTIGQPVVLGKLRVDDPD